MKLRLLLSLTVTGVTAAALLASFALLYFLVGRDELRDLDQSLLLLAHRSAQIASAGDPLRPLVDDGAAEVPEAMTPTTRYLAVYGKDDRIVVATRSFGRETPSFESLGITRPVPWEGAAVNLQIAKVALRGVVVPMGHDGRLLLYAASRRTVDEDTGFLNRALTAIFLAATGLTALVALWLGGRLASDVDAIAKVARAVAEGELSARVGRGAQRSTETKSLASDLDHMIERLGELVAAQRTFISHAAHELRSPLTTLRGELQLALRRPREAAEYQQTIEDALGEVEALTVLAEDLLTLARVEASAPGSEAASIGRAVEGAIRMARGLAEARGVDLIEIVEGSDAAAETRVPGSEREIARVLRNLIDNAVAHSPPGGAVKVTIAKGDGRAVVAVSDQGSGVSAADAPHIFAPFFRGSKDQGGDEIGAGLGLAIARGIARRHGGDVMLDEGHQGGARLVLDLPIEREEA
jgi:two-component system, OmpR family, sensor kinase